MFVVKFRWKLTTMSVLTKIIFVERSFTILRYFYECSLYISAAQKLRNYSLKSFVENKNMSVYVYIRFGEKSRCKFTTSCEIARHEITFKLKYQIWPVVVSWNSGGSAIVYNFTCEKQSRVISSTQNNMYTYFILALLQFCSLYWILMGAEICFTKCTMIPRPPPPDKNPGRNPSHYSGKWYYYHNTRHVWVSNNFSKPFRSILQAIVSKIAEKRFWKFLETQTLRHLHRLPATTIPALYGLACSALHFFIGPYFRRFFQG